jgi:hypothetical protein
MLIAYIVFFMMCHPLITFALGIFSICLIGLLDLLGMHGLSMRLRRMVFQPNGFMGVFIPQIRESGPLLVSAVPNEEMCTICWATTAETHGQPWSSTAGCRFPHAYHTACLQQWGRPCPACGL